MKPARTLRKPRQPRSLIDYVRRFLTPVAWKRARQAVPRGRALPRWDLQPSVLIMIAMTWAAGDSQPERFETARGSYVARHRARKRPGKTLQGFQKALSRVPMRQFRALAAGVRREIRARYGDRWLVDGFEPMGCDGSRIEAPRTRELEKRLGRSNKDDAAPTLWLTAFVHLPTGLLWSWRTGPGNAAEQVRLRRILETISQRAIVACDAAYMGFDLVRTIVASRRSFLFRMSSRVHLYTPEKAALAGRSEGPVLSWPACFQKAHGPIPCRLIRIAAKGQAKHDVWLLTDILDPDRLSLATAE